MRGSRADLPFRQDDDDDTLLACSRAAPHGDATTTMTQLLLDEGNETRADGTPAFLLRGDTGPVGELIHSTRR